MAAPNHKAARKIDFCGPVHSGILPKKRGVQVVISSSGRHAVAQLAGTTFLAQPVSVVKLAQPVAVPTSVLSPKEPPPDTILLSPQRKAMPEIAPGSEERIMANTMNFEPLECGEGMDECAAAMVLMNLSCSPRSPNCWTTNPVFHREASSSWSDRLSPSSTASSSGVASYPDATPSPPLTASIHHTHHQGASHHQNLQYNDHGGGLHPVDEGIHIMDDSEYEASPKEGTRTAYKCTWKGCDFITLTCSVVERHVRDAHLGPRDEDSDEDSDSEVEFYYTEIDVTPNDFPGLFDDAIDQDTDARDSDTSSQHGWQHQAAPPSHYDTHDYHRPYQQQTPHQRVVVVGSVQEQHLSCNVGTTTARDGSSAYVGFMASSAPTMSHMDMARPPHENPELRQQGYQSPVTVGDTSHRSNAVPISIPQRGGSCHPYGGSPLSPHKYPRFSPKSCSSPKISVLRPSRRADSKKCRKVYGVDNRDMWCTQCKWKKACSRFND